MADGEILHLAHLNMSGALVKNIGLALSDLDAVRRGYVHERIGVAVSGHVALSDPHSQYTAKSTLSAKGDIYVASAANTPARQAVGTNERVLIADSSQANGVRWALVDTSNLNTGAVTNQIFRNSVGCSIVCRTANSLGSVTDLALTEGHIVQRQSNVLVSTATPSNLNLVSCVGQIFTLFGQEKQSGSVTFLIPYLGNRLWKFDGEAIVIFPVNVRLIAVGVDIRHGGGTNPGDWTLNLYKDGFTSPGLLNITLDNVSWARNDQIFTGLSYDWDAGDPFWWDLVGPSASGMQVAATFFFVTR